MPAAPLELLAMANSDKDSSSDSCGRSEDSRGDPHVGDVYIGTFGDVINCKSQQTLRIGFQNVGGLPAQRVKIKEDIIRLGLNKYEFDIFGMAEINLDWRTLKEEEKLPLRTQEWWDAQHVSWTHNRTSTAEPVLQGTPDNLEAQLFSLLTKLHIELLTKDGTRLIWVDGLGQDIKERMVTPYE